MTQFLDVDAVCRVSGATRFERRSGICFDDSQSRVRDDDCVRFALHQTQCSSILLLGALELAFLGSYVFSLRVAVYADRIVLRNWWWRAEARWEDLTRVRSVAGLTRLGVPAVSLHRRGRSPLHLCPPFAAQRELVPLVTTQMLRANPTAIVEPPPVSGAPHP